MCDDNNDATYIYIVVSIVFVKKYTYFRINRDLLVKNSRLGQRKKNKKNAVIFFYVPRIGIRLETPCK